MQCIIYFRQFGLECFTSKCHGALIPCIHLYAHCFAPYPGRWSLRAVLQLGSGAGCPD